MFHSRIETQLISLFWNPAAPECALSPQLVNSSLSSSSSWQLCLPVWLCPESSRASIERGLFVLNIFWIWPNSSAWCKSQNTCLRNREKPVASTACLSQWSVVWVKTVKKNHWITYFSFFFNLRLYFYFVFIFCCVCVCVREKGGESSRNTICPFGIRQLARRHSRLQSSRNVLVERCHFSLFHDAIPLLAGLLPWLTTLVRSLQKLPVRSPPNTVWRWPPGPEWHTNATFTHAGGVCARHAHWNSPRIQSPVCLRRRLTSPFFYEVHPVLHWLGPCLGWAELWLWLGWSQTSPAGGKTRERGRKGKWRYNYGECKKIEAAALWVCGRRR